MSQADSYQIRAAIRQIDEAIEELRATREALLVCLPPVRVENVSVEELKEYARDRGVRDTVASRVWHLLHGHIQKEVAREHGFELEVFYETSSINVLDAWVGTRSLKRLRPLLFPGMVGGYGPRLHELFKGWIDSL